MILLLTILFPLAGNTHPQFFKLVPQDPLYTPYRADPFAPTASLQYFTLIPGSTRPSYTYLTEHEAGRVVGLKGYNFDRTYGDRDEHEYIFMRAGTTIPFARVNFGNLLRFEGFLSGGMRTVFLAFGGTDQLGFDGTYLYGAQARIGEFLSVQAGRKHFSGHTGDEILTRVVEFASRDDAGNYNYRAQLDPSDFQSNLIDYVHQDPQFIAVSLEPGDQFRLYGEMRFGHTGNRFKPDPSSEEEHPEFKARELQVGTELTLDGYILGDMLLSVDLTFHELGKFALVADDHAPVYKGQSAYYHFVYDENRPWDMDISITLAKQLSRREAGPDVFFQGSFYSGRFPLLAFFMHEVNYFSLGATITF